MKPDAKAAEMLRKKVGSRFRFLRERAGYKSILAVAEALDAHVNTVGAIERGESWLTPEMATLAGVAFGVPVEAFFSDTHPVLEPTPQEALAVIAKALGTERIQTQPKPKPVPKPVEYKPTKKLATVEEMASALKEIKKLDPIAAFQAQLAIQVIHTRVRRENDLEDESDGTDLAASGEDS